jgi:hypothetical protein
LFFANRNNDDLFLNDDLNYIYKSKQSLTNILNEHKVPKGIDLLKFLAIFIIVLFLVILNLMNFYFSLNFLKTYFLLLGSSRVTIYYE